jgi:uridine kinase
MKEKSQKKVYVVTRNSRRIEDRNYSIKEDAEERADKLVKVLKKWNDQDLKKVKVVFTDTPNKIR